MRLKLWEKSFLLTFIVFFLLLNTCLVMWYIFDTKKDYGDYAEDCMKEAESILYLEKQISGGIMDVEAIEEIADSYENKGVYIKLSLDENTLVDNLPEYFNHEDKEMYIGRLKVSGDDYYYIECNFNDFQVEYMKSMVDINRRHSNMICTIILIDILLALVVGILLYVAMRKIYKPVSDISHELRTPLTSILGYAQYLSFDGISDEDKKTAGLRIENEAKYMKDIVERLLTLDSLRGKNISTEKIDFNIFIDEFRLKYPNMSFESNMNSVVGDESLVKILLTNIIENAIREDENAVFVAVGKVIKVINYADNLSSEDVFRMNSGIRIDGSKIKGNGIGIELCREIVKAHGWELKYTLEDVKVVTTVIMR